jgi:murein DD-endopeptidase MepM/ murein hydrolase activator NlpD
MRKIYLGLLSIFCFSLSAQDFGGAYPLRLNDASNPCITPAQYKALELQIADAQKKFGFPNADQKSMTMAFSWPLKTANYMSDCSYYYTANYIDEDQTSPGILDYNCGSVTYDGHAGTDIGSLPYPFIKMDNNQVLIIAAAAGTIAAKVDGYFDKDCATTTVSPNYVVVTHSDGSNSIYYHMKKNSLTVKTVGQTVALGEYLGAVGSSGASTAPHLHFEVWSGGTFSTRRDPWAGACNSLNVSTWWASQKPYTEPAIIKAQINNIAPVLPACPTTETSNEDTCFVGGGTARFYYFIRNETVGLVANLRIVQPGNTTFSAWTHSSTTNYLASYWYNIKTMPTTPGTYTFETVYNSITCSRTFTIGCTSAEVNELNNLKQVQLSPNPSSGEFFLSGLQTGTKIEVFSILGSLVYSAVAESGQEKINLNSYSNGMYFVKFTLRERTYTAKILKE